MKYFLTCKMFADLFDEIDKQFVCFKSLRRYCTNKVGLAALFYLASVCLQNVYFI